MKTYDFIRYLTEELMKLLQEPQRRKIKINEPLSSYMFGIIPMSTLLFLRQFSNRLSFFQSKNNFHIKGINN